MIRLTTKSLERLLQKRMRTTWRHYLWRTLEAASLIASIIALGVSMYAIGQSQTSLELAETALNEQRKATAWQIALQEGTYAGKRTALELLSKGNEPIIGLDLSCKTILGKNYNAEKCKSNHGLTGTTIDATNKKSRHVHFINSSFRNTRLESLTLRNARFNFGDFTDANMFKLTTNETRFEDILFDAAHMQEASFLNDTHFKNASFKGADLLLSDFTNVTFQGFINFEAATLFGIEFNEIQFDESDDIAVHFNVSGAIFCRYEDKGDMVLPCPTKIPKNVAKRMWYWADNPPKGIDHRTIKGIGIKKCSGTDLSKRKIEVGSTVISLDSIANGKTQIERFWPHYFTQPHNCAVPPK